MKKVRIALAIALAVTIALVASGCGDDDEEVSDGQKPLITLVADISGLGDESFNDVIWNGCEKAKAELGVRAMCFEPKSVEEYAAAIEEALAEKPDLVVVAGGQLQSELDKFAAENPDTPFLTIDGNATFDNIKAATFGMAQGSFLAGVAAANHTRSGIVGFVGGIQNNMIEEFQYGYMAGVKAVDPNIEVRVDYTGNFESESDGKVLALNQSSDGADVIYHASGVCGKGVIEAAAEKGFWAIGVDRDQSSIDAKHVLCSVVKKADEVTYDTIEEILEDEFENGNFEYDLSEGYVGLSDKAGNIQGSVKDLIELWEDAIADGKVDVPETAEQFAAFEVPDIGQ